MTSDIQQQLEDMAEVPEREEMDAASTDVTNTVDHLIELLNRQGDHRRVFQYAGHAMVIFRDRSAILKQIGKGAPAVRSIPVPANKGLLTPPIERVSIWTKIDGRRAVAVPVPVRVPEWVFQHIIETRGEGLLPLRGVADFPVVDRDGRMLQGRVGYDADTGLYVDCVPVPYENHTFKSPQDAYDYLANNWLKEFNFASVADRALALTIPLTILQRRTRIEGGAPIPFVTAPDPNTGKTKLVECLVSVITGSATSVANWDDKEEERRKVMVGIGIENPAAVLFDNIKNGWAVRDATMERWATADTMKDRMLGTNGVTIVPTTPLPIFTGNNIIAGTEDLQSRSYEIRMIRQRKKRFEREDIVTWTVKNRAKIIAALYCILTQEIGRKDIPKTRFPSWARYVAGPLQKASGINNLFDHWSEEVQSGNDELEALLTRMASYKSVNEAGFTTRQMLDLCGEEVFNLDPRHWGAGSGRAVYDPEAMHPRGVEPFLRKHRDHAIGNYRLKMGKKIPIGARKKVARMHFHAEEIQ